MVALFVDAAPFLTPVMFFTGLVVTASSAGLMWMGWKEARQMQSLGRRRAATRKRPLRVVDAQA